MAKYKLRFADGTTLALDRAGLQTWVDRGKVDDNTAVQTPGSKSWSPLREFLASEGSGDGGRGRRGGGPPPPPESLKLAPIDDDGPDPDAEMYDGDVGEGPFAVVWLWVKRLVVTLVLLVGLGTAAAWWPMWLPWVKEQGLPWVTVHGVALFTAIDNKVHPERARRLSPQAEREQQEQAALDAAAEQLPYLHAAAVQRVMATAMVSGTMEPAEAFSRSHEAIQRGLTSLSPAEAQEARELKAALESALPGSERDRLREYDRMGGVRATLPFDDRQAMGLTARGFRALPEPQQRRLQALWGRALTAGLTLRAPAPAAPQATTAP
jgi:hypothetical protein